MERTDPLIAKRIHEDEVMGGAHCAADPQWPPCPPVYFVPRYFEEVGASALDTEIVLEALASGSTYQKTGHAPAEEVTETVRPVRDEVLLPQHYTRFRIEPIYFIMENKLSFCQGNVIKYVCRADAKNGVEDLRKARRYLDMMIKEAEGDPTYAR